MVGFWIFWRAQNPGGWSMKYEKKMIDDENFKCKQLEGWHLCELRHLRKY